MEGWCELLEPSAEISPVVLDVQRVTREVPRNECAERNVMNRHTHSRHNTRIRPPPKISIIHKNTIANEIVGFIGTNSITHMVLLSATHSTTS